MKCAPVKPACVIVSVFISANQSASAIDPPNCSLLHSYCTPFVDPCDSTTSRPCYLYILESCLYIDHITSRVIIQSFIEAQRGSLNINSLITQEFSPITCHQLSEQRRPLSVRISPPTLFYTIQWVSLPRLEAPSFYSASYLE
jgi:hypothetical protein